MKVNAAAAALVNAGAAAATEQQIVEANADMQMRDLLEHRKNIRRARGLFKTLLEPFECGLATS